MLFLHVIIIRLNVEADTHPIVSGYSRHDSQYTFAALHPFSLQKEWELCRLRWPSLSSLSQGTLVAIFKVLTDQGGRVSSLVAMLFHPSKELRAKT